MVKKHVFLNLFEKYVRLKWKKKANLIITIIIEYASITRILNKPRVLKLGPCVQNFEYDKLLNTAGFSIWKRYIAFWICQNMPLQCSEYILDSKCAKILTIAGFWISKKNTGFKICHNMAEYVWIVTEYAWICLNLQ